ncbi:MAG: pyridoxamine 5'-phosphate oxidase family protein [Rhodobacteraceae bacterium]|jgi:general stress protein 26|nr:pyridoxamine 5'-phosphate oxidase family protein [Paracoccaceae bacterium]
MADRDAGEARAELFERLGDLRAGMLGVGGSHTHMRPMTHYLDEDGAAIHFLTSRKTDLAREVGDGATAHYCVVDDEDGFYACISGTLSPNPNEARIDEIWNPVAAAWFAGRDDPDLMLLSMPMREAEVWTSTDSTLHFGIEIVRASIDPDRMPDVGSHEVIRF